MTSEEETSFVMGEGDRFHKILVSEGVHYGGDPQCETVIAFFVIIRRAAGAFDIVNVNKTFTADKCISRIVQGTKGVPLERIETEVAAIPAAFSKGIEKVTDCKMQWHVLDLSGVAERREQIRRIQTWGWLGVNFAADLPFVTSGLS